MGGGGTKSKSQSFSGSGQAWAQPYAKEGAGNVQGVFNQSQPGLQQLTGIAQNSLVPAINNKFQSSLGGAQQAQGYNQSVLNGDYMAGNPYMAQMLQRLRADVGDDVNGIFARSGRYGSDAHGGALTREMANAEGNMLFNNYSQEMARRDAAANSLTGANQQDFNQALGGLGIAAELPYTGSNNLANALGSLFSGGTEKSSSKQGSGLLNGLLGSAAQIGSAAIMACDERLKENISLNHIEADGLPVYNFTYRRGMGLPEGKHTMPMAQDVAAIRPWALGPEVGGYMTIYPGKL